MKKSFFFAILFVSFIFTACQPDKKSKVQTIGTETIKRDDTKKNNTPAIKSSVVNIIHAELIKMDTSIGDVHITYKVQDNKNIVSTTKYDRKGNKTVKDYADRSVILSVSRKGKSILKNKEIRKTDLISAIPYNEITKYCISGIEISTIDDYGVNFTVDICVPNDFNCRKLNLLVENDGLLIVKRLDGYDED